MGGVDVARDDCMGQAEQQAATRTIPSAGGVCGLGNGKLPVDRPVPVLPGVFQAGNVQGGKRLHQTQKPLELMRYICKICVPGGRILDPFAGSGSTLEAAALEGYDAIGVELSPEIAKTASERLRMPLRHIQEVHDDEEV